MTAISIDKNLAEQLIDTSLKLINDHISNILRKWNYSSSEQFIDDAKKGILSEAEDDAISLRNLIDKQKELFQLMDSWEQNE